MIVEGSPVVPPGAVPPPAELLEIARAGRLAVDHPRVCRLVSDLAGPDLLRAGRLLADLDPDEVRRHHPGVAALTVAITGHGTLAALKPALAAQFARHGLTLRPFLADFDNYVRDLLDPQSDLLAVQPDLVLCVLDAEVIFDEVPVPWRPEDVERVAAQKLAVLEKAAAHFAAVGRGTLVLNTLPLLRRHSAQLVDHRSRAQLGAIWREANARLLQLAECGSVVVLDTEPLIGQDVPVSDGRLSTYTKAHFTTEFLGAYAAEVGHLARQANGDTKKVLVLDLDNTLWGGVLGDDGIDGIEIGDGYRGEAFLAFQRVVKQIGSQGVVVGVVSKNEPELVTQALRDHPRMLLREGDFVQVIANWQPKAENLRLLAETLNLSPGSFVFVDDSPFEREQVRWELPGVTVIDVDTEPAAHVERLLRDGWFDSREVTLEDRTRALSYRDDVARKSFLDSFESVHDYLDQLGVQVRIGPVKESEIPRISQLTLRSNQFNLTTGRLQPGQVQALTQTPGTLLLSVHASDRFGDHGLVGAILTHREGPTLEIDNFLLSCRVFSRSIEEACLTWVLRHARATGAASVLGRYRASGRNGRVADFYLRNGFQASGSDDDAVATFRHDLTTIAPEPRHVQVNEFVGSDQS